MKRPRGAVAVAGACMLALSGCHRAAPTGQVLATVGGRDITHDDLRVEWRAEGLPADAGKAAQAALLQRVIDRVLLARSAHAQKLDQTPDAPSNLERIEQGWRAERAVSRLVSRIAAPGDAEAERFIDEHPYAFAKRERVGARTLTLAASPALYEELKPYKDYGAASAYLTRLGVPVSIGAGVVDTAQLPTAAASKLAATAVGTLLITTPPGRIQLAEVQLHTAVPSEPREQMEAARRAIMKERAAREVKAELTRLRAATRVSYQAGYAPRPAPARSVASRRTSASAS